MILRSIQLAFRYALKFKTYSFINIGGLALGLASAIAILNFVSEEFSYDNFHRLPHNVYRLNTVTQNSGGAHVQAAGSPLLAPTLIMDIPEVESAVRLRHADDVLVKVGEKQFFETKVFYADSNFFSVLSFPLAQGNPDKALNEINTAVITSEFAEKYFGQEDPVNKIIEVSNIPLKVTGVTLPTGKSHFKFDILVSFETFIVPSGLPPAITLTSWSWTSFPTYVRLREGTHGSDVEAKFPGFIAKYLPPDDARYIRYQLQPIKDVYLHSRNIFERDGISTKGDYAYTLGMAAIAALILGIACFNFMNLSTALSIYRIKETGIRRTLGSGRIKIFSQFILESMLTTSISMILGITILQTGITVLEELLGTRMDITPATHLRWLPFYLAMIILIGCFGGLYPAVFLSGIKPQLALKGKNILNPGSDNFSFRKAIIVFQFFITAALIAASLTIKKQMDFLLSKDLGYDKEGLIALRVPGDQMYQLYPLIKDGLTRNSVVRGVSASSTLPDGQLATVGVNEVGNWEDGHGVKLFGVYPDFIETLGLEMAMGRTFPEQANGNNSFILNEAAVKMFDWNSKEVIGRKLQCFDQTGELIGVVKDFHFSSLHSTIDPLIFFIPKTPLRLIYVRVGPGKINETLNSIESDWKQLAPHLPFDYVLLDEHINQMYRQDKRFSELAYVFCGLSVMLACLGLYGVISFMAETRTKEIGIRKVLGASVSRIVTLLSRQFMIWVVIAAVIALPVSYFLLNRWLSGFSYRIDVSFNVLILSVLVSSLLAGITVSIKSIKAARANPIDSLRSE